jgi:polyprenyldihydroxybenzoate methyltransferase/3-demethylubiquinol 3-O-methyltransferase
VRASTVAIASSSYLFPKPGGSLILSTISRTPFAHLLTITFAEQVMRTVSPGTHTYSKYVKPDELAHFFRHDLGWATPRPISEKGEHHLDNRFRSPNEALEVRGVAYLPWKGTWELLGRQNETPFGASTWCNYFLGARRPLE